MLGGSSPVPQPVQNLPPWTAIRSAGRRIQPGKRTQPGAGAAGTDADGNPRRRSGTAPDGGTEQKHPASHALEKVVYGEALTAEDAAAILSDGRRRRSTTG